MFAFENDVIYFYELCQSCENSSSRGTAFLLSSETDNLRSLFIVSAPSLEMGRIRMSLDCVWNLWVNFQNSWDFYAFCSSHCWNPTQNSAWLMWISKASVTEQNMYFNFMRCWICVKVLLYLFLPSWFPFFWNIFSSWLFIFIFS